MIGSKHRAKIYLQHPIGIDASQLGDSHKRLPVCRPSLRDPLQWRDHGVHQPKRLPTDIRGALRLICCDAGPRHERPASAFWDPVAPHIICSTAASHRRGAGHPERPGRGRMKPKVSDYLPLANTHRSPSRQYQTNFRFVSGRRGIAACVSAIRIFGVSAPTTGKQSPRGNHWQRHAWVMIWGQNRTSILSSTLEPMN
jgi:hypothetical protein